MYLPFLMLGYAAAALLLLAGLHVGTRAVPGLRGTGVLRWALSCALVGVLLGALRTMAPEWITILCANAAILACFLLLYCATAAALAVRARWMRHGVAVWIASVGAIGYFTFVQPNLVARILLSSGCMAVFAGMTAETLFGFRDREDEWTPAGGGMRPQTRALGWLELAVAANHVLRCFLTILHPPSNFVHLDAIQTGFTYLNMILNVGAVCGVIWLGLYAQRRGLQREAGTDSLTGLLNRRSFEEILARELQRASHSRRTLGVLMVDIDHFKAVNDSLGHQAGDEAIRRVANTLRNAMRPTDRVCRLGGEEFVMLIHDAAPGQALEIASRLRNAVAALLNLPGSLRLTASLGLAFSAPGDTPEDLLDRCDQALYRSKHAGRNCVTVEWPTEWAWREAGNLPSARLQAYLSDNRSGTWNT